MPIALPKFDTTHCVTLAVCGELQSDDQSLKDFLKSQKRVQGKYRSDVGMARVDVFTGGRTGRHVHIDIDRLDVKGNPKVSTVPITAIRRLLTEIGTHEVVARVRGMYLCEAASVHEFIVNFQDTEVHRGEAVLNLGAGTFTVKNSPIAEISWGYNHEENKYMIVLSGKISSTTDNSYLNDCLSFLDRSFEDLVARD